jgi:outer membrane lipoprotein-sorting protein
MTMPDEQEVIARLQQLAAVQPRPASTARALERVRVALAQQPVSLLPTTWFARRKKMLVRFAAALVIAAGLFSVVFFRTNNAASALAFADVQEKIKQVKSITCKQTKKVKGQPDEVERLYLLGSDFVRMERANGEYNVLDLKEGTQIVVSPQEKKAMIFHSPPRLPVNLYDILRNVPKEATKKLPERDIDGVKAPGFVVPFSNEFGKIEFTVWVDPKTQLPLRFEADDGPDRQIIISDFVYDQPLDPALFSMKPPEGFQVQTAGLAKLPDPPKDKDLLAPEVKPGVGIGPIKFGASKDEVLKHFGKPDVEEGRGTSLNYNSRGYGFAVSPKLGVIMIYCYTQATFATKVRDFQGKTTEGIGMGSSQEQVVKAYGKPDKVESMGVGAKLKYDRLNMEVTLLNDKVIQLWLGRCD